MNESDLIGIFVHLLKLSFLEHEQGFHPSNGILSRMESFKASHGFGELLQPGMV
jgi:hypothetical protein